MVPIRKGRGSQATNPHSRLGKPKQTPSATPKSTKPSSRWPHLVKSKQPHELLTAHAENNAFLSLKIPSIKSHVVERGWLVQSREASLYSSLKSAERVALQLVKKQQAHSDQQEKQRVGGTRIGFLSLALNREALERSHLPFARIYRTGGGTVANYGTESASQISNVEILVPLNTSIPHTSEPSNELKVETESHIPSDALPDLLDDSVDPGLTDIPTPEALEISPITPSAHSVPQYFLPSVPPSSDFLRSPVISDTRVSQSEDVSNMSTNQTMNSGGVDENIKDVIQNLFEMQQHVASFRPELQDGLNRRVEGLATSLQRLDETVADPNNPIHDIKIAPDIIDYVDDGRNPDIYTRDFVELVQRGNAVMNGKQRAFRNFSKIFAKALKENFEGMDEEVDLIMQNAGMVEMGGKFIEKVQNGNAAP